MIKKIFSTQIKSITKSYVSLNDTILIQYVLQMLNEALYNRIERRIVFWKYPNLKIQLIFPNDKDLQKNFSSRILPIANVISIEEWDVFNGMKNNRTNNLTIDISQLDNDFFKKALMNYIA